jgi:ribosomal protein S27AE
MFFRIRLRVSPNKAEGSAGYAVDRGISPPARRVVSAAGYYLVQDESNAGERKGRCARCHEYVFMFSKNERYYYDHMAIAAPHSRAAQARMRQDIAHQKGSNRVWGKAGRAWSEA